MPDAESRRQALLASIQPTDRCELYELVQYECELQNRSIDCTPFVRLFLRCAGKPTIEVTPEYDKSEEAKSRAVGSGKSPPRVALMDDAPDK